MGLGPDRSHERMQAPRKELMRNENGGGGRRRSGKLAGLATMHDVARLAGVSPMTVSNAYKYPDRVQPATRQKIFAAAVQIGYVPNLVAGNLASGRSRVIGAVVPSIRNSSFARVTQGLGDYAAEHGYDLLLSVANTPERELKAIEAFLGRRADGIVLTGVEHSPQTRERLSKARTAIVEIWTDREAAIDMSVGCGDAAAAAEMTRIMVDRGYRTIGFVGHDEPRSQRFEARREGFRAVLREAGLRDDLVVEVPEPLGFAGGARALDQLLAHAPALDAIFCVTDVVAVGAMLECMRRGWGVPERVAIAGYGNYEIAAQVPPGLATIDSRGYEIGWSAAELIAEKVETGTCAIPHRNIGYGLVVRGSV